MNTLSGGRRKRRTVPENVAATLLIAAFALAAVGLVALIAYRMVEQITMALGA